MRLQTKFILTLLSATLLAFIGAQVFQQILGGNALNNLSRENLGLLEQREQLNAENIYRTIDPIVQTTITLGEMPKLDILINTYSNVDGLLEYSIYSNKGVAAYSTSREIVKSRKTLPADLKNQLLGDPAKFARRTGEAFEIYKPMVVTAKCLECHDDFKMGAIGGVALLRLSADALAKSKQSWTVATTKIQNTDIKVATYTTLVIALVFSVLTWWTVKRLITVPIGKIITSLKRGAEQLNSSSTEITSTSQSLAEGASEQAASLEETSASLEEISSMTQRNAQNVASAKEFTAQTRATAESGAQSTQEMGQAMNGIRTASGEMRDAMNGIKAASNDVSKIIKTIDEIAFQTNILALNAAVEAARAGEAGMGFAVVADEVRNLAQRSAKAAKETADMIETSIKRSDDGVRVTDRVVTSVEEVAAKSQQLEQKLAEILAKAQKVDEQVTQIASASQEQSQGIGEVNMAVSQMDKVTQGNAANAEESAAAATELNAQAEALQDAVHELEKLVGGSASEPAAPQANAPAPSGFRPNISTFKSRSRPVVTHKPASAPSNSDFPMLEPAGADRAKSGFKDF